MSLADRLARQATPRPVRPTHGPGRAARRADPFVGVRRSVHDALLETLGPKLYDAHLSERELEQRVTETFRGYWSATRPR